MKNFLLALLLAGAFRAPSLAEQACVELPKGFVGLGLKRLETPTDCVAVMQIYPGGPGDQAGIAAGDFIVAVNGTELECAQVKSGTSPWPNIAPGDELRVTIRRNGQALDRLVRVSAQPAEILAANDRGLRMEAAINLEKRFVRTKQVFTVFKDDHGKFQVTGAFPTQEAALLQWYFEQTGAFGLIARAPNFDRAEMYIRFDPAANSYSYEVVDPLKK